MAPPANPADPSETEERILEAAHRVFLRHGTAGARTTDIAEEAGVNRALLHYYFRSKERLAEAVFQRAARSIFPAMLGILASDLPLRRKLQKAIETEIEILEANPYLPGYLVAEFQYQPDRLRDVLGEAFAIEDVRDVVFEKLQRQLDEEAAAGRLREVRAIDLMLSLISQVIFPFAAAPMLEAMLGLDADERAAVMRRRRQHLVDDVLRGFSA